MYPVTHWKQSAAMNTIQAYLRAIRIGRSISQEHLAESIGMSRRALIDWEQGKTEGMRDARLFQIIDMLQAAVHHVYYLGTHPEVSAEQATAMAEAWLKGDDILDGEIDEFLVKIQDQGKMSEALTIIRQLSEDPSSLDRLLGYGQGLLDRMKEH